MRGKGVRTKPRVTKARFGLWQFNGIDVEPDEPSARQDSPEKFNRMPAITERAIHGEFARLWRQDFHHFSNQNREVHACRRPASGNDPGYIVRITFRGALFILFRKLPWVLTRVPLPSFGLLGVHQSSHVSGA